MLDDFFLGDILPFQSLFVRDNGVHNVLKQGVGLVIQYLLPYLQQQNMQTMVEQVIQQYNYTTHSFD